MAQLAPELFQSDWILAQHVALTFSLNLSGGLLCTVMKQERPGGPLVTPTYNIKEAPIKFSTSAPQPLPEDLEGREI